MHPALDKECDSECNALKEVKARLDVPCLLAFWGVHASPNFAFASDAAGPMLLGFAVLALPALVVATLLALASDVLAIASMLVVGIPAAVLMSWAVAGVSLANIWSVLAFAAVALVAATYFWAVWWRLRGRHRDPTSPQSIAELLSALRTFAQKRLWPRHSK